MTPPVRHYCTLFDRNYTVNAVALFESLDLHASPFRLYALCMDEDAFAVVAGLGDERLVPLRVSDVMTDELREELLGRMTHGQFCWTCQPHLCRHVLDAFGPPLVTYLEADSYFFSSPEPIFDELGDGAVSLVAHRFSPHVLDQTSIAGRYCVQFNAFANDADGRAPLDDWARACAEYSRERRGYLPGQLALDDWPARFPRVVEIENVGAGVAPWNVQQYRVRSGPRVDGRPVIFFHFHQFAAVEGGGYFYSDYPLSLRAVRTFYRPYVQAIERAERRVRQVAPGFAFRKLAGRDEKAYRLPAHAAWLVRRKALAGVRRARRLAGLGR
jgi:hypothetical protein